MAYKIMVTPDAIQNIDDAVYFYKKEVSDRVAKKFIDHYKQTFKDILKNPYFQVFFQDFRGKPMKKFPYIVFYTIDESLKIIFIKAVFHTSQDPKKYPSM
ncbi:type II toxin-antitoxin system RelE/ParE family toxin [Flavobacterium nackdongense]|uniref:Type II toxin-antitoxin system RelE/ParE family toxin n=1 Tax=Flavobacterium nackdongense TaxID=2547394 RepID=A0A4P6YAH1_9FLAO|nr:type II toxin-antitoxin system RelE/ParE family toxin [Flavobacterium nackdongense]QBN17607.1 type II toxin-antitoxin system RelE/ParE family toxin [Flavobacterium nackdongense]